MTEVFLVRHAVNDWVSTGRLAGWTPGVHLNEEGRAQAAAVGQRLAAIKLAALFSSPLERTLETARAICAHQPSLQVQELAAFGEIRFGRWQGARLKDLRRERLWAIVQQYPSRVQFPEGETFRQAQARAIDALESLALKHPSERIAVVSHSDLIKLIVAHYLGMHLDLFQRIEIAPASLSIVVLGTGQPLVRCVNDTSHLPPSRGRPPERPREVRAWLQKLLRARPG